MGDMFGLQSVLLKMKYFCYLLPIDYSEDVLDCYVLESCNMSIAYNNSLYMEIKNCLASYDPTTLDNPIHFVFNAT